LPFFIKNVLRSQYQSHHNIFALTILQQFKKHKKYQMFAYGSEA
jgi:hypothetical protein